MHLICYIRFVSDHGLGVFKNICQHKLLAWKANQQPRAQPPSFLEWKSIKDVTKMALDLQASDGNFQILELCLACSLPFALASHLLKLIVHD